MPELPDVETYRHVLETEALRRPIAGVDVLDRRVVRDTGPKALGDALEGRALTATRRRGKWLFAQADDELWLALHFGMTGDLAVTAEGEAAPRSTRVTFRFADGGALHFVDQRKFGRLALTPDPGEFAAEHDLGPDALDPTLTERLFAERLRRRSGKLKALLLDQSFVAGVGNIYGDEICHEARIAPLSPVEHLRDDDVRALYRAMRSVLETAVARMEAGKRMPVKWLIGERHIGGVCKECGEPVARARLQGRYTYWCPCSQRAM